MRKNVASQVICAQLVSKTDGSDVTSGTTTVYVTGDNGSQVAGSGTVAHVGQGTWSYVPTQAETNYTHIAYTFVNTNAVSAVVNVYTVGQDFTAAQLNANMTQISGDTTAADNLEAAADGTTYNLGGGAIVAASVTAEVTANVAKISGDAIAADNAEAFFDGTGYTGTNNVIPTVTEVTNGVSLADDAITAAKFDESTAFPLKSADTGDTTVARTGAGSDTLEILSGAIATAQDSLDTLTGVDGATLATIQPNYAPAIAGDAMTLTAAYDASKTAAQAGDEMLLTAAYDAAKTAAQPGDPMTLANDAVSAAALAADALAEIKAEVEAVLSSTTRAELAAVPAANASLADKLTWITMILRNKRTQTNTTETVYADDGSTPVSTSSKTDDGTTYTRSEYV